MNADLKYALKLLAGVAVVGGVGAIIVHAVREKHRPKGKPGEYVYQILSTGEWDDGTQRWLSAISPDFGDFHEFKTLGYNFRSIDEAKAAALKAIEDLGGVAKEFVPLA